MRLVGLNWDHLGFSGFITKKGRERRMKGGVFSCPRLKPQPQPPLTPKNLTLDPIYERERERQRETEGLVKGDRVVDANRSPSGAMSSKGKRKQVRWIDSGRPTNEEVQ